MYHNLRGTPPLRTLLNSRLELPIHFLMNFVLYTDGLLTGNLLPGVQRKSASNIQVGQWVAEE